MPFTDPIDILIHEHEAGLTQLEKLNSAAQYILRTGFSPEKFGEITEAIQYIETKIRDHYEKEEKFLFPLLERHIATTPKVMMDEHRELWKTVQCIRQNVEDIEEGRIYASTVKEMLQAAGQLYQLFQSHIAKENMVLFPMARKLLTPEEYGFVRQNIIGLSTT